ncbi:TonB-dependent receptor [Cytophagaceae bacterium DM2B3-1]|uniref:TonB-dependent receptor n=1 Tax=Xanthocytophaga flava TaxID=3048013 RepID=A0ABT7CUB0_9BACT|nr:TonB-dependent receptor [Xanthocytophaga flavus]MDJ1496522.1 TonB-dependent receptor [Xanthocytophaga flavus]
MKHLYACMLILVSLATYAQKGTIHGIVKTVEGQPAPSVTVVLKDTRIGTVTDEKGSYTLRANPGTYTLQTSIVGFTPQEKEVTVEAAKTTQIDEIRLQESAEQLQEVIVTSNTNKFANKENSLVSRLPIKNLENPQVYNVVSKELMEEQVITDYKQSLRNVPGAAVAFGGYSNGFTYSIIRGFWTGARMRNGLAAQQYNGIDPVTVERTEAIKGPSGTLFGSSLISFGGLTNLVTKRPLETFQGNVNFTTGSWGLTRLTADINTPLNKDKTLLFRLNTAFHSEGSFMDWGGQRRFVVAPTLTYKVDNRLTLNFEAEILRSALTLLPIQNFSGVSVKNIKDLPIRYNQSLNSDDMMNRGGSEVFYAQAVYRLSDNWTSNTLFSSASNHDDEFVAQWNSWRNDSIVSRSVETVQGGTTDMQFQQNFTGDFRIAGIRNRMVIGADVYYSKSVNSVFVNNAFNTRMPYDTINVHRLYGPVSLDRVKTLRSSLIHARQSSKTYTYSAYISDVVNITERLMAMLSLRVDRYDYKGTAVMYSDYSGGYAQTALSPKFGLVYQPIKDQVSVFANYMNGFQNNGPVRQPDGNITNFKPQNGNQWEVGVKMDAFSHKLSATISYYNIDVTNAIRQDPSRAGYSIQDGKQRSKGLEVDIIAEPITGLSVITGFGTNEYKYVKADEGTEGTTTGLPGTFVNFWLSYKVPHGGAKGLGAGFGGNYVSEAYTNNEGGSLTLPAYTLIDATVFYDQPKWRFAFKLNNLTDQKMWGLNNNPMNPRNIAASVSFKF